MKKRIHKKVALLERRINNAAAPVGVSKLLRRRCKKLVGHITKKLVPILPAGDLYHSESKKN